MSTLQNKANASHLAVALNRVSKTYKDLSALNDLTLSVPAGCFFALLGPNGAGKSTTLKILSTLTSSDSGDVLINGIDVNTSPREVRKLIGYVAQDTSVDKVLTGYEHLTFSADLHHLPRPLRQQRIAAVTEQLAMGDWLHRRTGTYSGGMRRRLELACALLHEPSIFILDEPSVGLDPESRHLILNVLRGCVNAGRTVIISTHQLEEVELLADQLAIIDQGHVIAAGTPTSLKKKIGSDKLTIKLREFTTPEEAQLACKALSELSGIKEVIINPCQGYALTLIIEDKTVSEHALARLAEAGLPLFAYNLSKISLDDVYLRETGRTIADAELSAVGLRDLKRERKQAMR